MPDGFEPEGAFQGYVYAKLEGIEKKFDNLPCEPQDKRLRDCENKVSNMQGKATIIGLVFGVVGGFIGKILYGK